MREIGMALDVGPKLTGCHELMGERVEAGMLLAAADVLNDLDLRHLIAQHLPDAGRKVEDPEVVAAMVLNRLDAPQPLYAVADWAEGKALESLFGLVPEQLNDDRLAATLDRLAPVAEMLFVEIAMRARQMEGVADTCMVHDLTSVFLTGEYGDSDLAAHGYSRDHRPDCKQINTGLTIFGELPMCYRLYPGNTPDVKTMPQVLADVALAAQRLGDGRKRLIMDRAGASARTIVSALEDAGVDINLVFSPNAPISRFIESLDEMRWARPGFSFTLPSKERIRGFCVPATIAWEERQVAVEVFIYRTAGKRRRDQETREKRLRKIDRIFHDVADRLDKRGWQDLDVVRERLAKRLTDPLVKLLDWELGRDGDEIFLRWSEHPERMARAKAHDGVFCLIVNQPGRDAKEVLLENRRRAKVERSFEVLKQTLQVRPVFVQREERLRALVFINMVALLVWCVLQRRLRKRHVGWGITRVKRELGKVKLVCCPIGDDWSGRWRLLIPQGMCARIYDELGLMDERRLSRLFIARPARDPPDDAAFNQTTPCTQHAP